jgi:hypothetical protein
MSYATDKIEDIVLNQKDQVKRDKKKLGGGWYTADGLFNKSKISKLIVILYIIIPTLTILYFSSEITVSGEKKPFFYIFFLLPVEFYDDYFSSVIVSFVEMEANYISDTATYLLQGIFTMISRVLYFFKDFDQSLHDLYISLSAINVETNDFPDRLEHIFFYVIFLIVLTISSVRYYQMLTQRKLNIAQLERFQIPLFFLYSFLNRKKNYNFFAKLIHYDDSSTQSARRAIDSVKSLFEIKQINLKTTDKLILEVENRSILFFDYVFISAYVLRSIPRKNPEYLTLHELLLENNNPQNVDVDEDEDEEENPQNVDEDDDEDEEENLQNVDEDEEENLQNVDKIEQKEEQKVDLKSEIELRDNLYQYALQNKDKELKKNLQNIMKKHNENVSQKKELQQLKYNIGGI